MASFGDLCEEVVTGYPGWPDRSVRRLLVTVFGDSIEPRGGAVWLGSLIRLVAPLSVSERLVRTSVQRLVGEGVLSTTSAGRRSFYSVTQASRADFRQAERRIYHRAARGWDGRWTLVLAAGEPTHHGRAELRRRLGWLGFGAVMPGVYAHPTSPLQAALEVIADLKLAEEVAVLRAESVGGLDDAHLAGLVSDVEEVVAGYGRFLDRWSAPAAAPGGAVNPDTALLARTLLVDDYRRVILRDPDLPAALLPPSWVGAAAFAAAAILYRRLDGPAETYLGAVCEGLDGALPPRSSLYRSRFLPSGLA